MSRYQKGKTNLDFTVSGSGISWAICKSAPHSRQITMPATHHYVNYDYNYVNYYYITLESQTHIGGKPVVPREKITLYLYVGLNQFKLEKPTYKQYNLQHTKQYNLVPVKGQ